MQKIGFVFLLFLSLRLYAQKISPDDLKELESMESAMSTPAKNMVFAEEASTRFEADSVFTKEFVKALKIRNSFYFPFDSIITVSKLMAPDSSFRIFTWELKRDESYFRQKGAIQMRTKDGSLKLFPLLDMSDYAENPVDSVRSNLNWIGAIYYNLIMTENRGKKYYTLFGFDDNNFMSTRKWLEVLTFNDTGQPVFGGQYFDYKEDSLKSPQPAYRFLLEFKKDAGTRLNYDPETKLILFDHLVSESNETQKKFTLVPDGDFEAFKWQGGRWLHIDTAFHVQIQLGNEPRPKPLFDESGNPDEELLLKQSEQNEEKQPAPKKKVPPNALDEKK
ncbi:MAG: hypothetical protein JSS67_10310 [Bacteroidetes bacterium]|nr:hypothetical protein [Bacteroidota bacterium]